MSHRIVHKVAVAALLLGITSGAITSAAQEAPQDQFVAASDTGAEVQHYPATAFTYQKIECDSPSA